MIKNYGGFFFKFELSPGKYYGYEVKVGGWVFIRQRGLWVSREGRENEDVTPTAVAKEVMRLWSTARYPDAVRKGVAHALSTPLENSNYP